MIDRFLYEHSVSHRGHLIIPYVQSKIAGQSIYTYRLLSEQGRYGTLHKFVNPSRLYSNTIEGITAIAKEHLSKRAEVSTQHDFFKDRYTYRHHLIIVYKQVEKYFYDHYPPTELNTIAAPKIFRSEPECLRWIKQGLDRNYPESAIADK